MKTLKFADDTNIYRTVNNVEDIESSHLYLCNLVTWSTDWQMLFNVDKCNVMRLGYNNHQVNYVMETSQLQRVTEDRDLEIIVK